MLDELTRYLAGPLEDDPTVRLDGVTFDGPDAALSVSVLDYGGTETWTRWRVQAVGVVDYLVADASGVLSFFAAGHVLSRVHTEPVWSLFFREAPRSAHESVGRLFAAHQAVTNGWIPFDRYLNGDCVPHELLQAGYGRLAEGPEFLIRAYSDVLESAGLVTSLLGPRPNRRWTGREWLVNPERLATLIIGEAFFVADSFDGIRIDAVD